VEKLSQASGEGLPVRNSVTMEHRNERSPNIKVADFKSETLDAQKLVQNLSSTCSIERQPTNPETVRTAIERLSMRLRKRQQDKQRYFEETRYQKYSSTSTSSPKLENGECKNVVLESILPTRSTVKR